MQKSISTNVKTRRSVMQLPYASLLNELYDYVFLASYHELGVILMIHYQHQHSTSNSTSTEHKVSRRKDKTFPIKVGERERNGLICRYSCHAIMWCREKYAAASILNSFTHSVFTNSFPHSLNHTLYYPPPFLPK